MASIEVLDRVGIREEALRVLNQAVSNAVLKNTSDAPYLKTVRVIVVKSIKEELESRAGLSLRTERTENIKTILNASDPRVIEILVTEELASVESWRIEGAVAHEIAEARLIVEEEFSWRVINGLQIFAPYIATLIEDAVRERLADAKMCRMGYSGYIYHVFLEDIPTIASELGRCPQLDNTILWLIMLRGDRSLSLQISGQKRLGEHAYSEFRMVLEKHNPTLSKTYDRFRQNLVLSGELSPFAVERALAQTVQRE